MPTVHPEPPADMGTRDGLAYALFLPAAETQGGVVILHGAGSRKESHLDFARRCAATGVAAVSFDQRGHGASAGALDDRMADDVATIAAVLPPGPVALRGSSMGGYLALVAARCVGATAVVAICPAPAAGLRRGLCDGRLAFRSDATRLDAFLAVSDERDAAMALECPMLLLHATGDEQVPVEQSRGIAAALGPERCTFVEVPGGDHRSIQHDPDLQDLSVAFLREHLAGGGARG